MPVLDLETGESRTVIENGRYASYLPTGHLVYGSSDDTVLAISFDVDALTTRGSPKVILDGVLLTVGFSFSPNGTLAYLESVWRSSLNWVSRDGEEQLVKETEHAVISPQSSSTGTVALSFVQAAGPDIWVYQQSRDVLTRLTFGGNNLFPVWSPDGERIAYLRFSKEEGSTILSLRASGVSVPETLFTTEHDLVPTSWSPDGRTIWLDCIFEEQSDICSLDSNGTLKPVVETEFDEFHPMISPDGASLAYVSNESEKFEVYVRALFNPGGKWQISRDGGDDPVWNSSGQELFYRNGNTWMSVEVEVKPEFRAGVPKVLFQGPYEEHYTVTPGGNQFIVVQRELRAAPHRIQVVTNLVEELNHVVPTEN
jgi:Tol biopolymer transport system component